MLYTCGNTIEGNTYSIKDILKSKYKCYWDSDTKKWTFEQMYKDKIDDFLSECNRNIENNIKTLWKNACDILNIHYAKKGTQEYNVVKNRFLDSLKEKKHVLHQEFI